VKANEDNAVKDTDKNDDGGNGGDDED